MIVYTRKLVIKMFFMNYILLYVYYYMYFSEMFKINNKGKNSIPILVYCFQCLQFLVNIFRFS